jgi:N-glycosylase/DNA lyase
MKLKEENNRAIIDGVTDFHPDHTFDNGQCFRWNREADGSYTGVAFGRVVNIGYGEETLTIDNAPTGSFEAVWKNYLDLNRDYGAIKRMFSEKDPAMKEAVAYGGGMRILQQDKWETLISFILSQNNNIARIKKCVEGLCAAHGKPVGTYRDRLYYAFPSPEELADLSPGELDVCRLGYRAKYIVETAKQIAADGGKTLYGLDKASAEEAYEYLLSLSGVGPKVANCIMLFSMGKYESFPLDVWIKRVMHQVYHIEEGSVKKMQEYAASHFGEYGGIAQQYLFYYMREISKSKREISAGK